jgi:hypothetical protein
VGIRRCFALEVTEMKYALHLRIAILLFFALFAAQSVATSNIALIKEEPHNIYHVIKNKPLLDVTNQIANRSGIVFKIDAEVEHDLINQKLAADNWGLAIEQLLANYNFATQSENSQLKTVLITGRRGSGKLNVPQPVPEHELIVVEPNFAGQIPKRYKDFAAGSVLSVNLPMEQLNSVRLGDEITLDLPIGQYSIKHDNKIKHDDGSSTWIGYLNDEGQGYRVYLSQGESGIIGNIYTPDGAYNIETANGETVLVDIDKSGLQSAGYENDEAELSPDSIASAIGMTDLISGLQQAADTARSLADTLASEAAALLAEYQQLLTNRQSAKSDVVSIRSELRTARSELAAARRLKRKSPHDQQLADNVTELKTSVSELSTQRKLAVSTYRNAAKATASALAAYNKKAKLAKRADTNAKKAEAEYAAKATETTTPPPPDNTASNSEIDLMVLYTTANQTAEYAKQRIQYLVDISNQAYKDSGINLTLRLVHTRATNYVENNANAQALSDMANDRGAFSGTAALRNQYGADLVALFRPLYAQTAGSCGTAYVGFANGSNANAALGFGTIGDGYSKDAKSSYFCGTNTFTHEIGHSLGNVHDREYSSVAGKFAYSYAWGISRKFGTIMSYYTPTVMLFSTPALSTQCAGTPCGFAEGSSKASDQTRTINATAPLVANYRTSTIIEPVIE